MKVTNTAILLAALLASSLSYAASPQTQPEYLYTVKPGDNLSTLSSQLLDSQKRWSEVAAYNKLKNPQIISPGQVLHLQLPWLKAVPAEAVIESIQGEVKLNGQPAKVGDKVATGANLESTAGASVRMTLPDGSTLNMLENTQLQAKELGRKPMGDYFSAVFRLVTGRIDALKKKYPDGQSPLRIQAMHGTIGVRGTHFRMGQEGENTLAEIEHGLVGFEGDKTSQVLALSGGEGSIADGVHAPATIELLPAPQFLTVPERYENILVRIDLAELAGAVGFRGEVAEDEAFSKLIAQANADGQQLRIPDLQDGTYWVRVRGVDSHGLQGKEATLGFVLKAHPIAPMLILPANNGKVRGVAPQFAWNQVGEANRYHFQLARDSQFKDVVQDVNNIATAEFTPDTTPALGNYYWRVASLRGEADQGPWGNARVLQVLSPAAPPSPPAFPQGRMVSDWDGEPGQTFEYQLSVKKDFSTIALNLKLDSPKLNIAMPAPNQYYVRLRAIDADGYVGPWTPVQSFLTPGYDVNGCSNCRWGTPY